MTEGGLCTKCSHITMWNFIECVSLLCIVLETNQGTLEFFALCVSLSLPEKVTLKSRGKKSVGVNDF